MKKILFTLLATFTLVMPSAAQSTYVVDSTFNVGREYDATEGQFTLFYTPGVELSFPKTGATVGATFHFDAFNGDLERIQLSARATRVFSPRWSGSFEVLNIGYRVNYFDPHQGVTLQFPKGEQRFNDWQVGAQLRYRIRK